MAILRLVVLVSLVITALAASFSRHKPTSEDKLLRLIIGLLDGTGDSDDKASTKAAEYRYSYLVRAGLGNISIYPQFILPDDRKCRHDKDCKYEITLYDVKLKNYPADVKVTYFEGSDAIEIEELQTDEEGRCYYVRTCRIEEQTLFAPNELPGAIILDDRCTCHRCQLWDTKEAMAAHDSSGGLNLCFRLYDWSNRDHECTDRYDVSPGVCHQ